MDMILGRSFPDQPVYISSLKAGEGLVTIRGKVSQLKIQDLNDRKMMLLLFTVTDHSASVLCKAFLGYRRFSKMDREDLSPVTDEERKTVLDKVNEIKQCHFVTVRGEYDFDSRLQGLSILIRDLAKVGEGNDHEL